MGYISSQELEPLLTQTVICQKLLNALKKSLTA